jgi:hypothetical protein
MITSTSSQFAETSKIKSLNDSEDWIEWNRKLNNYLDMIDLWKVLTENDLESDEKFDSNFSKSLETTKHRIWRNNQNKLSSLLLLITDSKALLIIEMHSNKNATDKYKFLKNEYNSSLIITFIILYRKIFRCFLINHKNIKKYDEEIVETRNKLKKLDESINELTITCSFLDDLNSSYQK